jgi:uncharacterized protein
MNRHLRLLLLGALAVPIALGAGCDGFAAASEASSSSSAAVEQPLQVLLVTGGGWHDYDAQKGILEEGLSARMEAEFTVDHEAGTDGSVLISRHADTAWAAEFDAVIYNMCFSEVQDAEWVDRLVRAHIAHQVPAVVLHCALHSYNFQGVSPIWSMFAGVYTRRHQRQMPFTVEALDEEHPVMAGFSTPWETPAGELYEILDVYPTATPLAHAFGEDSGEYHVNVWVNEFAGVRVFGTTIGHHNETMAHENYLDMVASGLLWAVGRLD